MANPTEAAAAFVAALMMAASPVTGECQGREVMLCRGDGTTQRLLLWDDKEHSPAADTGKACHACVMERRRSRKARAQS